MRVGGCTKILNGVNIAHSVTYYTNSFDIGSHGTNFGIWLKGSSSAGAPSFTVQIEQSYTKPTTEGAADTNWVIPNGMADIVTDRVAETAFITSISPVPMPYARYKITTGAGSNDDSVFTIVHFQQEE